MQSVTGQGRVRTLADSFGGSMLLDRITDPRSAQPRGTGSDGDHGKPSAIKASRRKGLGRIVQDFAVRKNAGFGKFVERINSDLHHEQHEEDRCDLKESPDIDQVPK